jgi:hypothetical protein
MHMHQSDYLPTTSRSSNEQAPITFPSASTTSQNGMMNLLACREEEAAQNGFIEGCGGLYRRTQLQPEELKHCEEEA